MPSPPRNGNDMNVRQKEKNKERKVTMDDEIKLTEEQEKEFANGKGDDEE